MDAPVWLRDIGTLVFIGMEIRSSSKRKESNMNATTVAADSAESVSQMPMADEDWRMTETGRLARTQLDRWWANLAVPSSVMVTVVVIACGAAGLLLALTRPGQPVKTAV